MWRRRRRPASVTSRSDWALTGPTCDSGAVGRRIRACGTRSSGPTDSTGRWRSGPARQAPASEFVEPARAFGGRPRDGTWSTARTDWRGVGRPQPRGRARRVTHVFDAGLRLITRCPPSSPNAVAAAPTPAGSARPSRMDIHPPPLSDGSVHPPCRDLRRGYELVREATSAVRQIRADYGIPPARSSRR